MSKEIPNITESTKFNLITSIWIVPFIALIIAGWLAYQHYDRLGPEIKIVFPKNEGLIAGQSVIKFRNVPVGKVTKIHIDSQSEGVVVYVRANKDVAPYMTKNANFWIVKPEVGMSGVSGLETIISGTYISMVSENIGDTEYSFNGLSHSYRTTGEGEYFSLIASTGYNVKVGTPIYFKNILVGQVEYINLSSDNKQIEFVIFVQHKYKSFIHRDSRFWVRSMVDIDFSNGRLNVDVAPLDHIIRGGISFSSTGWDINATVDNMFIFPLYPNIGVAEMKQLGKGGDFIKTFEIDMLDSIAKLKVGAPIRYDGYDVGRVDDIKLSYNAKEHKMLGKIFAKIDTSSFAAEDENISTCFRYLDEAIKEGLHAKIANSDPITNTLYVDLVFETVDTNQSIKFGDKYTLLPSIPNKNIAVVQSLENLLAKLNLIVDNSQQPIEQILVDLNKTMNSIALITSKDSFVALPDEIEKMVNETTKTVQSTRAFLRGYDSNSLVRHQIIQTLEILTKTSKEMKIFLRMLNRKPNSMIFGDK